MFLTDIHIVNYLLLIKMSYLDLNFIHAWRHKRLGNSISIGADLRQHSVLLSRNSSHPPPCRFGRPLFPSPPDSIRFIYDIDTVEFTRGVDFMFGCIYKYKKNLVLLSRIHSNGPSVTRMRPRLVRLYVRRVATQYGNQGKQGKWPKQIPCREKSGNFKI